MLSAPNHSSNEHLSLLLARFSSCKMSVIWNAFTTVYCPRINGGINSRICWKNASFLHTETLSGVCGVNLHAQIFSQHVLYSARWTWNILWLFSQTPAFFRFQLFIRAAGAALHFFDHRRSAVSFHKEPRAWAYIHTRRLSYPEQGNTVKHRVLQIYGTGKKHRE